MDSPLFENVSYFSHELVSAPDSYLVYFSCLKAYQTYLGYLQ